jgi:BatD DUF11 like domain
MDKAMNLLIGKNPVIGKAPVISMKQLTAMLFIFQRFILNGFITISLILWPPILFANTTAEVDRSHIEWNETIRLTIETDQSVKKPPLFSELEKDFDILGQSQSKNYSIINGDSRSSHQWHLELAPKTTGTLTIPSFEIGGEYTPTLTIEVQEEAHTPPETASIKTVKPKSIYLTAAVDQIEPFVQSQVLLTLELYYMNEATEGALSELKLDHAIIERLGDKKAFIKEVNRQRYHVVQVQYAIFPQKAGAFTIPEIIFEGSTALRKDAFFNNFSGFSQKRVREKTNSITLMVKEIPSHYPKNKHWISATSLEGEETLIPSATHYQLGDSITRKVILKATDQLSANLPNQFLKFESDQAKIYPDNAKNTQSFDGKRLVAVHEEAIAIIPNKDGLLKLPALEIPWWNTQKNQLMFFRVPERNIQIQRPAHTAGSQAHSSADASSTFDDTAHATEESDADSLATNSLQKKSIEKDHSDDHAYQLNTLSWIFIILFSIVFFLLVFLFYRLPKEVRNSLFKTYQRGKATKYSNTVSSKITPEDKNIDLPKITTKMLKKNVVAAFTQQDPVEAKQAILDYAKEVYQIKDLSFQSLLENMQHEPLKTSLKQLEKALYAKDIDWHGHEALLAFEDWSEQIAKEKKSKTKKTSDDFSSLYPTD